MLRIRRVGICIMVFHFRFRYSYISVAVTLSPLHFCVKYAPTPDSRPTAAFAPRISKHHQRRQIVSQIRKKFSVFLHSWQ